ncbi:MAG: MaoC/PaaZ C-terminal domain-containing protein [Myxococcota bacterium]
MSPEGDWMREMGFRTVTEASVATFGCLTGDYAQMHFDLGFSPSVGMGTPVAHGLLSAAWSLGALSLYAPDRLGQGNANALLTGYRIRFGLPVPQGSRFSLRARATHEPAIDVLPELPRIDTEFETRNAEGETTCSGALSVSVKSEQDSWEAALAKIAPAPLEIEDWDPSSITQPLSADQIVEKGPRGESLGRTVSEADLVNYTQFTGELNPLYTNEVFAETSGFGSRIAPPMWSFCSGFGDYLRDLLSIPMPSSGFAGHLGDQWRFLGPIRVGDTIRTRHKPVAFQPSRSRPEMGIVQFALQVVNQRDEIVQDGQVAMMMSLFEH